MGDQLKQLATKKNIASLLVLAILTLAIPLGVQLVRQEQILRSQASSDLVAFASPNVEARTDLNGSPILVALDKTVGVKMTAPNGWAFPNGSGTFSPSPGGTNCQVSTNRPDGCSCIARKQCSSNICTKRKCGP